MITNALQRFAASTPEICTPKNGGFFSFPTWYKYLQGVKTVTYSGDDCVVRITKIADFWLVLAAIMEMLLRIGSIAAIVFIIYGGISFITSEGQPDKTSKAIKTVISACVGLVITIGASAIITFIAGRFN